MYDLCHSSAMVFLEVPVDTCILQPQIRKSWDSMENANKKESSDF